MKSYLGVLFAAAAWFCFSQTVSASDVYWVSTTGSDEASGTEAEPFATLSHALSVAGDGDTVKVMPGRYVVPRGEGSKSGTFYNTPWAYLTNAVTVVGVEGPDRTVFDGGNEIYTYAFRLNNAQAVLTGVTISNCNTRVNYSLYQSGTLDIESGIVSNCVVRDSSFFYVGAVKLKSGLLADTKIMNCRASDSDTQGGGLTVLGAGIVTNCLVKGCKSKKAPFFVQHASARVYDCVVTGCEAEESYRGQDSAVFVNSGAILDRCVITNNIGRKGGGVNLKKGTLRNSIVAHNTLVATSYDGAGGGGVWVQSDGTLESCTVVGNRDLHKVAHGVYQQGGTVRNCIINCNAEDSYLANDPLNHVKTGGSCTYTCTAPTDITGEGNIWIDPKLMDLAAGNYALSAYSTCFDVGQNQTWMTDGRDLFGNARIQNEVVNMGAVETPTPAERPFSCTILTSVNMGARPLKVSFSFSSPQMPEGTPAYLWDFGDGATSTEAAPEHTYTAFGTNTVKLTITVGEREATDEIKDAILVGTSVAWVKSDGGNVWPYDEESKAATNFAAALKDLFAPTEGRALLRVSPGTIVIPDTIDLGSVPLEIVGDNENPEGVLLTGGAGTSGQTGLFRITADNVLITGLMIRNSAQNMSGGDNGAGITMAGGVISNCVMDACSQPGTGYVRGSVNMTGGTFTHGIIRNATSADGGTGGGGRTGARLHGSGAKLLHTVVSNCTGSCVGGIEIDSGTVSNCVVENCSCYSEPNARAPALHLNGAGAAVYNTRIDNCHYTGPKTCPVVSMKLGGRLQNCLVARSTSRNAAALLLEKGTVESCTIAACTNRTSGTAGLSAVSGTTVCNTIVWDCEDADGNTANISGEGTFDHCLYDRDPLFRNAATGDYRVKASSPAVNAGVLRPWMGGDATDLGGNPRVLSRTPDIGCYETVLKGLVIIVK